MLLIKSGTFSSSETLNSEITIATLTRRDRVWVKLDGSILAGGPSSSTAADILEVRAKTNVTSSGTEAQTAIQTYVGGLLPSPTLETERVGVTWTGTWTFKQVQGTARSIKWELLGENSLPQFVVSSSTDNTSTTFKISSTSTQADAYKNAYASLLSGTLKDQVQKITAYSSNFVTVQTAFSGTPAAGDFVAIVNQ